MWSGTVWLSNQIVGMFQISKETVEHLREELAAVRSERDALKAQIVATQSNFEWVRTRVNSLEVERAQLIKKAYGIDTPIPEIVRAQRNPTELNPDIFNDVGEDMAKTLGLPVYNN